MDKVHLSLSRFMVHEASEARRPPAGWWTVHGPAVLPARVPGSHQCDGGRVAAPRFILCGRNASTDGVLLRPPSCPEAPLTLATDSLIGINSKSREEDKRL